jgi:GT2 family glycosyltransferase
VRVLDASEREASLAAQYDVLVFVGEDVLPLSDCIPALLRSLCRLPDAAVVGGRVVGWDGRLCEAGGVLSDNGTLHVLGAGRPRPDDPVYGFVREVDWCSRSLLATWRGIFEQRGGFDASYRSSRFQDAEYCLSVRQDGRRVFYQPESVVVRLGGGRPTVEEPDGRVFAERWARADRAAVAV